MCRVERVRLSRLRMVDDSQHNVTGGVAFRVACFTNAFGVCAVTFVRLWCSLTSGALNLLAMLRHIRTSGCRLRVEGTDLFTVLHRKLICPRICGVAQCARIKSVCLRADCFAFGELLLKSTKSNQKCLLSVGPFVPQGSFTKVAIGGDWTFCVRRSKARLSRSKASRLKPVLRSAPIPLEVRDAF